MGAKRNCRFHRSSNVPRFFFLDRNPVSRVQHRACAGRLTRRSDASGCCRFPAHLGPPLGRADRAHRPWVLTHLESLNALDQTTRQLHRGVRRRRVHPALSMACVSLSKICVTARSIDKGLSLLELVTVLFFVGTLATIAVVHWEQVRQGMALRTAVRQVMFDLFGLRLRAAATNRSHRLVFSTGATSYQRQSRDGSVYTNLGPATPLPKGVIVASCNAMGQAITFRPRGNASTFGTIVLRNSRGEQRQVVIDIAGRVRLQE